MKNKKYWPSSNDPVWLEEGYRINESVFCETFIPIQRNYHLRRGAYG